MKKIKKFKKYNKSDYSDISKSIGWNNTNIKIPTIEEIEELTNKAENGDKIAFKTLFSLNRFANPKNIEEVNRLNLAVDGFRKTKHLFEEAIYVNRTKLINNWSPNFHINKKLGKFPYVKNGGLLTKVEITKSIPANSIYMKPEDAAAYNEISKQIIELKDKQDKIIENS